VAKKYFDKRAENVPKEIPNVIKIGGICYEKQFFAKEIPSEDDWDDVDESFEDCSDCFSLEYETCKLFAEEYSVTSPVVPPGPSGCCDVGGCCNYEGNIINSIVRGGEVIWSATSQGPAGTSDFKLVHWGGGNWTIYNICQTGCHPVPNDGNEPTAFYATTTGWNGKGCRQFTSANGYVNITVCEV